MHGHGSSRSGSSSAFRLLVNGALILAAGIYELMNPPRIRSWSCSSLHANVWWGAVLLLVGLFYCVQFAPQAAGLA